MRVEGVADYLSGPTAIALSSEDTNEVAKILYDFAKETPALEIKGGLIDNENYDAAKLEAFSKLPGKKQLIAMIASTINAPVQKLAATLQAYVDKSNQPFNLTNQSPLKEVKRSPISSTNLDWMGLDHL
jgi:large subunit ribosomal protein L10